MFVAFPAEKTARDPHSEIHPYCNAKMQKMNLSIYETLLIPKLKKLSNSHAAHCIQSMYKKVSSKDVCRINKLKVFCLLEGFFCLLRAVFPELKAVRFCKSYHPVVDKICFPVSHADCDFKKYLSMLVDESLIGSSCRSASTGCDKALDEVFRET